MNCAFLYEKVELLDLGHLGPKILAVDNHNRFLKWDARQTAVQRDFEGERYWYFKVLSWNGVNLLNETV